MSGKNPGTAALFVYGTLLQESNSEMAAFMRRNSTDLGSGYIFGRLYDLGDYPGAVVSTAEGDKVYGHLYQLHQPADVLPALDAYEEFGPDFPEPNLFIREVVEVHFNGTSRYCWVYLYNGAVNEAARIASGDYLAHLQPRRNS
ncbi:gamma-glutamylcyclotransferase family protein [Botryobacter ruber]|uniref:gamma-glutamylcyclotransferase family protein n=1 Tax=Botryobacter ruber TaxID=2171629 RepID=UPI000E0C3031|nr:gamma-glutamylcyclotransferase family protein [Botryobacter ruber]